MEKIPRHEKWRAQYRERRYLRHLDQAEIEERARDVIANMLSLSERGQISFPLNNPEGDYWMVLWTDMLEELGIREGGFQRGFLEGTQLPVATYPTPPRSHLAVLEKPLPRDPFLLKFGEKRFMELALSKGEIRVNPATTFEDSSLNPAIRDDELAIAVQRLPEDVAGADPFRASVPLEKPPAAGGFTEVTVRSRSNYYVYCMAYRYELRLVDDFAYDACLVIRDPRAFVSRVAGAVRERLPDWHFAECPVTYVDPLNYGSALPDVFYSKHFRYSYQREYRLAWLPPAPAAKLEPLDLKVAPLGDIAELIAFPSAPAA
jgi:hypothetical protein